jgi:hypothetical protein
MTEKQILQWIQSNLKQSILPALPGTIYTEDWLGAMACREVGGLINRYRATKKPAEIFPLLKGDYTQRPGETEKQYHGFGPWQIDVNTDIHFINAGEWMDPHAAAMKAVQVLESKRRYLTTHTALSGEPLARAITAAYNCGEGNIVKVIARGLDIDAYTANHNYSADVFRMREIYKTL